MTTSSGPIVSMVYRSVGISMSSSRMYGRHRRQCLPRLVARASRREGVDEVRPGSVLEAFVQNPVVFLLGSFTGIMALDIQQDPLKSWIDERVQECQGET